MTVFCALLLAAGGFATLTAQGPANPFDVILTKLDQIITILTAPPPPTDPVTLSTPPVLMTDAEVILCGLVNVGTEPISVNRRILNADGETLANLTYTSVLPGITRYAGIPPPGIGVYRWNLVRRAGDCASCQPAWWLSLVNFTRMSVERGSVDCSGS